MHLSDTLVLGPLPLQKHPVRLPLWSALAGLLALLLGGGVAILLTFKPLPARVAALAAHLLGLAPAPTPAAPGLPVRVDSVPAGATILLDGQVLGSTPMTVAVPAGHSLLLQRTSAPWSRSSTRAPTWLYPSGPRPPCWRCAHRCLVE